MNIIPPRTGDVLSDPFSLIGWLDRVRNLLNANIQRGAFAASLAANQTGATGGAFNKVLIDTEQVDIDSWLDSTSTKGRYTPLVAGTYFFTGTVRAAATATDSPQAALNKNGSIYRSGTYQGVGSATDEWSVVSGIIAMNGTTDYVELYAYLPATVTVITGGATNSTNFSGYRISG